MKNFDGWNVAMRLYKILVKYKRLPQLNGRRFMFID
jgi:hypothetical protein